MDIWYQRYNHHNYMCSFLIWESMHEQMLHVVFAASYDVYCLLQKH